MADVQPLRTLRYEPSAVGSLDDVIAPPYDVIDAAAARASCSPVSPYNVVEIDLPRAERDRYEHAARHDGRLARATACSCARRSPALWVLRQDYTAPDGSGRTRTGILARVRVEDYGAGRIRPHERTHPGPKEDRLRLTRATRTNLSPIFSLFPDRERRAPARRSSGRVEQEPFAEARRPRRHAQHAVAGGATRTRSPPSRARSPTPSS